MNIAIWGAGKFGLYVGKQLYDVCNIVCFIDNYPEGRDTLLEKKVVSPEEYLKIYENQTDMVLIAVMNWCMVYEQIRQMKVKKFGVIDSCVYQYQLVISRDIISDIRICWNSEFESKKAYMKTLETNVVDFCNLNCKGCSHFSNLFCKGDTVGFESFEKDIKQLSNKVLILHFDLLGGEPFLSTDLAKYIKCLRDYMPKTSITIVSNGILIPRQNEELLSFIKENNVLISITQYPPTIKLKSAIEDTLNKFGIKYEFRKGVKNFGKNIDLSGKNNPYIAQTKCREILCRFLRNGKIYKCPFSALGNNFFDKFDIALHFEEGIDIYNETIDLQKSLDLLDTEPIEQCRFCGEEEHFIWEMSSNPEYKEWIVKE